MTTGLERHQNGTGSDGSETSLRSGGQPGSLRSRGPRQELAVTLLLGAVGAGLIFLATRQGWAHVRTVPPKPLPASTVGVTGAALVPYADALVLAGLATLAAILATRGVVRRLAGGLLAVIGAALGASAFTLTSSSAIAAATSNASPETAAAGSVMDGSDTVHAGALNVAGAASRVTFAAASWQVLVVIGAIVMIGAGALVVWRAQRMAVMSSRYDAPAVAATRPGRPEPALAAEPGRTSASDATGQAGETSQAGGSTSAVGTAALTSAADQADDAEPAAADSATFWEALSRGEDPTIVTHRGAGT